MVVVKLCSDWFYSAAPSPPADKKIKTANVAVDQPGQPDKVLVDTVADGVEVKLICTSFLRLKARPVTVFFWCVLASLEHRCIEPYYDKMMEA